MTMRHGRPFWLILNILCAATVVGRVPCIHAMVVSRNVKQNRNNNKSPPQQQQQPSTDRSSRTASSRSIQQKSSSLPTTATTTKKQQSQNTRKRVAGKTDHQKHDLQLSKQTNPSTEKQQQPPITNGRTAAAAAGTVGEAVQRATSVSDLLEICSTTKNLLWLPTDADLPIHLKQQSIHHDRRQRWSAQLLSKLGDLSPIISAVTEPQQDNPTFSTVWQDERLARAVLAAAYPYVTEEDMTELQQHHQQEGWIVRSNLLTNYPSDGTNRGRSVRGALVGLATLAGKVPIVTTTTSSTTNTEISDLIHPDIVRGIRMLLIRAESMADDHKAWPLHDICEMRWASRGLLMRLGPHRVLGSCGVDCEQFTFLPNDSNDEAMRSSELLSKLLPRMQERVKHLPFDILPMGVPEWSNSMHHREIMDRLRQDIPFFFDTIITRHGSSVMERRGTAWVTEPGIGALAYSGKLMLPTSPIPIMVQSTMRLVEGAVGMPRNFFDCALCNFYATGDAACQFHTDPEHGTMWERFSCVVAIGDPRRFAFRPIPKHTTWQAWDNIGLSSTAPIEEFNGKSSNHNDDDNENNTPAVIALFAGDIVQMWGTCNDDFHHAVYPGDDFNNIGRISLVLKRAIVHKGQRRGHGLPGEGRRSRR